MRMMPQSAPYIFPSALYVQQKSYAEADISTPNTSLWKNRASVLCRSSGELPAESDNRHGLQRRLAAAAASGSCSSSFSHTIGTVHKDM